MRNVVIFFPIGSESTHKLQALGGAAAQILPENYHFSIIPCNVESNVDPQPEGLNETFTGAHNRAEAAMEVFCTIDDYAETTNDVYAFGVESGVIRGFDGRDNFTLDIAAVVIIDNHGQVWRASSSGIQFPEDCVTEAESQGFDTTTVGQVMAERHEGMDHTDPHSYLTQGRISRTNLIQQVLEAALAQINF